MGVGEVVRWWLWSIIMGRCGIDSRVAGSVRVGSNKIVGVP